MNEQTEELRPALEAYGDIADLDLDPVARAGRYSFQVDAMRRIVADILPKLALEPHHQLLDIGCGTGELLIPLSYHVSKVTGLDHPNLVKKLQEKLPNDRIELVGGGFPETKLEGRFDRILAYSVMQCLPTLEQATEFALEAAAMLPSGGRLLLADVPNSDRQRRFGESVTGKEFEKEWSRLRESQAAETDSQRAAIDRLKETTQVGGMTDEQICGLLLTLRRAGYEAFILEQNPDLPFGRTREDIIVLKL